MYGFPAWVCGCSLCVVERTKLCGFVWWIGGSCVVVVAPWVCVDFLVVVGCRCGVLVANIVWLGDYGKQIIKNELFYNILIG